MGYRRTKSKKGVVLISFSHTRTILLIEDFQQKRYHQRSEVVSPLSLISYITVCCFLSRKLRFILFKRCCPHVKGFSLSVPSVHNVLNHPWLWNQSSQAFFVKVIVDNILWCSQFRLILLFFTTLKKTILSIPLSNKKSWYATNFYSSYNSVIVNSVILCFTIDKEQKCTH